MTFPQAELLLDNAETGAPGGVRALDADGRQLVFRHRGLQVELMLQTSRQGPAVWGKLFRAEDGLPCAGARAVLADGTDVGSAPTETDAWGEFCLKPKSGLGGVLRVEFSGEVFVCWLGVGGSRAAVGDAA